MTQNGLDGWAKRWFLSDAYISMAYRKSQECGNVRIWVRIFNTPIIRPFKANVLKLTILSASFAISK